MRIAEIMTAGVQVVRPEEPAHEQIAALAYHLWQEGGCRDGSAATCHTVSRSSDCQSRL